MIIFSSDYKRLISPFWSLQIYRTVSDTYTIMDVRDGFIIAEYETEQEAVEDLKELGRAAYKSEKFYRLKGALK